ncbi:MAG: hypothetical protein ABMA01_21000, partial [Chthoniobacteraceae bacterium]
VGPLSFYTANVVSPAKNSILWLLIALEAKTILGVCALNEEVSMQKPVSALVRQSGSESPFTRTSPIIEMTGDKHLLHFPGRRENRAAKNPGSEILVADVALETLLDKAVDANW